MIRILKSKKGMTLTEMILALAILGIISIPLIAVFSNSIFITQLTKRQLEINAVMQIAKDEVTQSVKNDGSEIPTFDDPTDKICLSPTAVGSLYSAEGNETEFLELESGNLQKAYKYKVQYVKKGVDAPGPLDPDPLEPNIVELIIKMYTSDGNCVSEIKTDILYKTD